MADRAEVPNHPLVTIEIDDQGRIAINGHGVPHDHTTDARQVATDVVCSDFARPLARPVRALVHLPHQQIRMVVHPDGRVADVESQPPATPVGVPPATRAQCRLAARETDRVAAEVYAARHAGRRRRYPQVIGWATAVALFAMIIVYWPERDPVPDPAGVAAPPATTEEAEQTPEQPIIKAQELRPFAVAGVSANTTPGVLRLEVEAQRATTAQVVVTPLDGSAAQRFTLSIRGATHRQVTVPEMPAGRYRWELAVPGQPRHSGVVRVPAEPTVEVDTAPVSYAPAPPDDSDDTPRPGAGGDRDGARHPVGVSEGPNHPVDPDGD